LLSKPDLAERAEAAAINACERSDAQRTRFVIPTGVEESLKAFRF
jgi:hypothetical protein